MRYLISWYGQQIAVGILEKDGIEEEINLAHNLFNSYHKDYLFHATLHFKSVKQFWKFLILKEYLPMLMDNIGANKQKRMSLLKKAFSIARETRNNKVGYENFMDKITAENNHYYHIGEYQDEVEGYEYS